MKRYLVDTNLLIRYLTEDVSAQADKVEKWFREGKAGKKKLVITSLVVAETCYVLESFYNKKRREISEGLKIILSQAWMEVENKAVIASLWPSYQKGLHFVDSYLVALAKAKGYGVLTFDKKLLKQV